jgi:uncharacterized protein (TIGR03000 family)
VYSGGYGCYGGCGGVVISSGCCGGLHGTPVGPGTTTNGNGDKPLTAEEQKDWADYLSKLEEADKEEAEKAWKAADLKGKRDLLKQAREYLKKDSKEDTKPITDAEQKEWDATVKKLYADDPDGLKEAQARWKKADAAGKRALLKQAKENLKGSETAAPATLVVTLPADARLTIAGAPTTSTSSTRVFVSPTLQPGKAYRYTLEASFVQDGKPVVVKKSVRVRAGRQTEVALTPATAVALGN